MRTVRFNVQMKKADIDGLVGLRLKVNAHDMSVHGRLFQPRRLLFRSHNVVSSEGEFAVVEMVLQRLDDTFPENKRLAFPVADLHLLLQDMTVPNVAVPGKDAGQQEVLEEEVADEQPVTPELLGMDANFDDATEDTDDGPERASAGDQDQDQRDDTAAVGQADRSYGYPRRDGD